MILLNEDAYYAQFKDEEGAIVKEKVKKALEQAWKNRDFEIEMYWKRATYFWAFIAATFGGYFAFISSTDFNANLPQGELLIACLGFIFAEAWYLANIGSKKWQVNWERHIDMLENYITGPIYKTVLNKKGYSVSELNKQVSSYIIWIWGVLIFKIIVYKICRITYDLNVDWTSILIIIVTSIFAIFLWKKAQNIVSNIPQEGEISFSLRKVNYVKINTK